MQHRKISNRRHFGALVGVLSIAAVAVAAGGIAVGSSMVTPEPEDPEVVKHDLPPSEESAEGGGGGTANDGKPRPSGLVIDPDGNLLWP